MLLETIMFFFYLAERMLSKIKIFLIGIWVPNALVPHKNQFWDPLIPTPDGLLKRIYKCDPVNVVYKIITGSAVRGLRST